MKHICLLHGYLLTGSGSNVYNRNLAREWKRQGYAVTIICQDPNAKGYPWVDEYFGPKDKLPEEPPKTGMCRVIVPDIAGLLLVYNYDEYDGYKVKTIPHCTEEEIEMHIAMTARAVKAVANQGPCHTFLANHALLSPVIASRGLKDTHISYDVKIHGSALNVVVKRHPHFKKYAIEGFMNCNRIIAGTRYIYQNVMDIFAPERDVLKIDKKLIIVPPGMDPKVFGLSDDRFQNIRSAFIDKISTHISQEQKAGRQSTNFNLDEIAQEVLQRKVGVDKHLVDLGNTYNQRVVEFDLPKRFPRISEDEPVIVFVGKFINFKGIAELILCFPKIVSLIPKVRLILVGYGIVREHMELMVYALKTGNLKLLEAVSKCTDQTGHSFLESGVDVKQYFRRLSQEEASRILITGFLNHEELILLLHLAACSLVVTKCSEAFGMVSVEAMAAGVLPLCVRHSGLIDVLDEVGCHNAELESAMAINVKPGGDFGACDGVDMMRVLPEKLKASIEFLFPTKSGGLSNNCKRRQIARELRSISKSTWSWETVCNKLVDL